MFLKISVLLLRLLYIYFYNIFLVETMYILTKVKKQFSKYLLFKGKISFNPSTLNNQVHTYFLAQEWQEQHTKQKSGYTYKDWIDLIQNSNKFNARISQILASSGQKDSTLMLFNDWSVYGDGMTLTQYKVLGILDTKAENAYNFEKQEKITSKLGAHKGAISDCDTDAQTYSKWHSFQLRYQNGIDKEKVIKFKPNSFRYLTKRVVNGGGSAFLRANWFLVGQAKQKHRITTNNGPRQIPEDFLKDKVFIKKSQYRYNSTSKLSNTIGFVTDSEKNQFIAAPNMQGWRLVSVIQQIKPDEKGKRKPLQGSISFKSIDEGLLIDFGNVIWDKNSPQMDPVYPKDYFLTLTYQDNDKKIIKIFQNLKINIEEIANKKGGLQFYKGIQRLKDRPLSVKIKFNLSQQIKNQVPFQGVQKQYQICIQDPSKKANLTGKVPLNWDYYLNQVQFDFYCTKYGAPVNEQLSLKLQIVPGIDSNGVQDFNSINHQKNRKTPEQKIKYALQKDPEFQKEYKSYQNIDKKIYGGKLNTIIRLANQCYQNWQKVGDDQFQWKKKGKNEAFQLFFQKQKSNQGKILFKQGHGNAKFCLDEELTQSNNPRSQFCDNFVLNAKLHLHEKQIQKIQTDSFTAKFFHVNQKISDNKGDWVNQIGPIIKSIALMYPSMQRIVNLYSLSNITMDAMRRVFEIEDQSHPRYMPSTRQISAISHRKIRKWLYEPLFNRQSIKNIDTKFKSFNKSCLKHSNIHEMTIDERLKEFDKNKKQLIQHLKDAFLIELTTIPLYSSALFSVEDEHTQNHLKRILRDQMKHLFILSNVLNSLHDSEDKEKPVPYTDPKYIPIFPVTNLPVLKVSSKSTQLKQFLKFDIQRCTQDQILKFIILELPSEIGNISIETDFPEDERIKNLRNRLNQVKQEQQVPGTPFRTIGNYYSQIIEKFWQLHDLEDFINKQDPKVKIFTGDKKKQFIYFGLGDMIEVYDLRSALDQFRLIVEEGQGANLFSQANDKNKHCHFIKFLQIYSGCDVQVKVESPDSNSPCIKLKLTKKQKKGQMCKNQDNNWTPDHDQIVKKEIQKTYCSQKISSKQTYPDAYSKIAFLNGYQKILEQLDYVFNADYYNYKQQMQKQDQKSYDDNSFEKDFHYMRTRRMQNAIAKMRQLRLHADHVISPRTSSDPRKNPQIGSRPNFNVNFQQKISIECPKVEQVKKQHEKVNNVTEKDLEAEIKQGKFKN